MTRPQPKDSEALMQALELAKQGDSEKALILVRRLLKRVPDHERAGLLRWTLEARLFEARGAYAEARSRYQHILTLRPDMAGAQRKLEELNQKIAEQGGGAAQVPSERPTGLPDPPSSKSGQNRRQSVRAPLDVDVSMSSESNFFAGFSGDISEGGLFIATYSELPVGRVLTVRFDLPSGHTVEAHAEVRWVRAPDMSEPNSVPGVGVSFVSLTEEQRAAIHAFMRRRDPLFFENG